MASAKIAQSPVLVMIQTLKGNDGKTASMATVSNAVAAYNKANKGAAHVAELFTALEDNRKGMQAALAQLATLARLHGATMIRLSVHNGAVALCGPRKSVDATLADRVATRDAIATAATNAYDAGKHGSGVSFKNAYACGAPAGIVVANKLPQVLNYGIGYPFHFPVPTSETGYLLGQTATAGATAAPKSSKPASPRKPRATAKPAAPVVETELETLDRQLAELETA